jgi:hypothetical protein
MITLAVTNDKDFEAEDIVTLARVCAGESYADQFYELKVEVVEDSEVALCAKCGKYMDVHSVWNACPTETLCPPK